MKFKHAGFTIIVSLIIISSILIGLKTKQSFNFSKNSDINIDNYIVYNSRDLSGYYSEINGKDDLVEKSEVILKVAMTNSREMVTRATLSKVKVVSVLKGKIPNENDIYIYEPYNIRTDNSSIYTYTGYLPMRSGEEYIVCLKQLEVPNGYKKTDKQEKSYMFINPIWGKYNVNDLSIYVTNNLDENMKLGDVKTKDVFMLQSEVPKYTEIQKSLRKQFGI